MSATTAARRPGGRLRLFWLMVSAFALAIALAICGLVGFVGLALAGQIPSGDIRSGLRETAPAYAAILTDYYVANGQSWAGVERRLDTAPFSGGSSAFSYTIVGIDGELIAGPPGPPSMPVMQEHMPWGGARPAERAALTVDGRPIGTLVVQPDFDMRLAMGDRGDRRPSFLSSLWRSFLLVGALFGTLLLGLAIIFARRLTRPLRQLTAASEALAAGRRDVRVPGAPVRELDELAAAFNRMADALAAADAQRRQMTADIAHELRTPLSIIRGRLEGLQDGVYSATPDQIEALIHEADLLERLIEDLRLLALADAGRLQLYREPCDPRELIEGAAAAFADQAQRQGVALRVVAEGELPAIDVDPQRIAQVLSNLVSNALRHTPSGGTIVLSAAPAAALVELAVEDSGSGIAAADLPHIFDRFWRADQSRTRGAGGAGLGLAIARQLVEAHGGSVEASSPAGARIAIRLPARQRA